MARTSLAGLLGWMAAWLLCTLGALLLQPRHANLDHDEIYWLGSAYYYHLAFEQRDWTHPAWAMLPARENPPMAKYVLGLGLAQAGYSITTIESLSYFYLFWLRWERNPAASGAGLVEDIQKRVRVVEAAPPGFRERVYREVRAPLTRAMVAAGRNTVAVCTVLAGLLLFLLVGMAADRLTGLLASQLLLLHPEVLAASNRAMSDGIALLFAIAAALALFHWFRRRAAGTAGVAASVVAGMAVGLACGAKMNALVLLLLAGALTGLLALEAWRGRRSGLGGVLGEGLLVLAAAIATFVLINPAILRDLPGGLAASVLEHRATEQIHVDVANTQLKTLPAKFAALVAMAYHGWLPFAGVVLLAGWLARRRGREAAVRFVLGWWVLALAATAWWLPFAWPRYVIPVLAPSAWLVAWALVDLLRVGRARTASVRAAAPELSASR